MSESFESPKKEKRLSLNRLQKISTQQHVTLGYIQHKANKDPVENGFIHDITLRCSLIDYRRGRLDSATVPAFAFVMLADVTTSISVGMSSKESKLEKLRLPADKRDDDALCCGIVELRGNITWAPSKQDSSVPTYIFNRGFISKIEIPQEMDSVSGRVLPSSDVLANLCRNRFFETSKCTTQVVWGKIDAVCLSESQSIVMSIEDTVGYIAIKICDASQNYMEKNNLKESATVSFIGPFRLKALQEDTNAFLSVKSCSVVVSTLSVEKFHNWVLTYALFQLLSFMGILLSSCSLSGNLGYTKTG